MVEGEKFDVRWIDVDRLIMSAVKTFSTSSSYVRVDAGVDGRLVHRHVALRQDVFQGAVVAEATPLCVNAHPPILALHTLQVLHLLHVAGVCSRTCRGKQAQWRFGRKKSDLIFSCFG